MGGKNKFLMEGKDLLLNARIVVIRKYISFSVKCTYKLNYKCRCETLG